MSGHTDRKQEIRHALKHVAHFLPTQGPIGVFVHHNTLHAFQHEPFEKAVVEAARMFRAEPYLPEEQYREALSRGRIRQEDVDAVLAREAGTETTPGLRRAMLAPGARNFDPSGTAWRIEEGDLARDFQTPALRKLFDACLARTEAPETRRFAPLRPADEVVHPWLIRLCSGYLDQGMSYWPMPGREEGFYLSVRKLLSQPVVLFPSGLSGLDAEFRRQAASSASAEDVLISCLGPDRNQWEPQLLEELLALPGWPGIFAMLENDPALFVHDPVPCTLLDYMAVRLTLMKVARANIVDAAPPPLPDPSAERLARAASLFEAARLMQLTAADVEGWTAQEWSRFVVEVESFGHLERRRIYHLAYERWHEQQILLGLASHWAYSKQPAPRMRPMAQIFFCIDDRAESMRRAVEEVDPLVETFGAAGFFGVAVDYKGIDDAGGSPLCPIVVKPEHAVREVAKVEDSTLQEQRQYRRRLWARLVRHASLASRSLFRGALSTAALGTLTAVPLVARVLAPREYGKLRDWVNRAFLPVPRTELTLMRQGAKSHASVEGLLVGFSPTEKADSVASVLLPVGLTKDFSRLVVILGHGATSLNNPHESAYNCGACGGRRGGPNSRLFAMMANRPSTREELKKRGIEIPPDTLFIGGEHDTCNDSITLFDLDRVPPTHAEAVATLQATLDIARARDAQERARRFASCPPGVTPERALRHVEERSEHLAQPRQECGHATNAVCLVGPRSSTRGLYLDRRAFLVSYDPAKDPADENLGRLLAAAVPVCAGINLEYYFSTVDNARYGSGSKLPHNVTGLVGVMDGHASDLRNGLPHQMIEIHEPVRILFVIEKSPERLEKVLMANPIVKEFVVNQWVRVAARDPETGEIHIRRAGGYEKLEGEGKPLPTVPSSADWFKGRMDHLPMAVIVPAKPNGGRP